MCKTLNVIHLEEARDTLLQAACQYINYTTRLLTLSTTAERLDMDMESHEAARADSPADTPAQPSPATTAAIYLMKAVDALNQAVDDSRSHLYSTLAQILAGPPNDRVVTFGFPMTITGEQIPGFLDYVFERTMVDCTLSHMALEAADMIDDPALLTQIQAISFLSGLESARDTVLPKLAPSECGEQIQPPTGESK